MSEYWKSTPKYWCKNCKVFVRDTKLEKQNHDATPRHQGNLKRFLRDLHRGHEKEEKDRERAKSEVSRLNGLVSGAASSSSSGFGRGPPPSVPKPHATPFQRKQQLAQLAEMGVSIPEEFRGEMAMVGEWQVTSERIVTPHEGSDKKPEAVSFGVRKRTVPDDDEGDAIDTKKGRWGSRFKALPGAVDDDLDALLEKPIAKVIRMAADPAVKQESDQRSIHDTKVLPKIEVEGGDDQKTSWKETPDEEIRLSSIPSPPSNVNIKHEEGLGEGGGVQKAQGQEYSTKMMFEIQTLIDTGSCVILTGFTSNIVSLPFGRAKVGERCEKDSFQDICRVLSKDGKITRIFPGRDYKDMP